MNRSPHSRVVLVTGGASGIGAAIAARFAKEGVSVAVFDADLSGARMVAQQIGLLDRCVAIGGDASVETDARRAIERTIEAYSRIDVLVNNVGAEEEGTVIEMSSETWDRVAYITEKFDHHRERWADRILPTLQESGEVWMTYYDSGEYRRRYIKVFEGAAGGLAVAEETPGGAVLFNFIPKEPKGLNSQRTGTLLYPKKEGK